MKGIYVALIVVCAVVAVVLLGLFIYLSNNLLTTSHYTIKSQKIKGDGVKIVQLSDLHGKRFGKGNCKLLRAVEAQKPNFIVITGDIIHKYREHDISVAVALVTSLCKIAPVYYVSGNHELRNKKYRFLRDKLANAGALILDDCAMSVCGINLCGVNCANIKKGAYTSLIRDKEQFNLLLAHLPQYINEYSVAGFDLALCGHAHGGQWRVPFTKIGVYSPGQGLLPKYTAGMHWCGSMAEIISRGLGNSECPVRLFNRPEIVVVNLINGQ